MDVHRFPPWLLAIFALAALLLAGCGSKPPVDTHLVSPYPASRVVAIAPFMNQSGSQDVDSLAVSDIFFSELQMVRGFQVLPVNRTLQAMVALKMRTLNGPADVLRLAEFLGADMIFVGAVTAYDPYNPPMVGLAVQLYALPGSGPQSVGGGVNPVALGRAGRPFPASGDLDDSDPNRPRSQINEVFNASHNIVQKQVRDFAEIRGADNSPLGWQLYVKSAPHYLRFCCHRAIRDVLMQEYYRVTVVSAQMPPSAPGSPGPAAIAPPGQGERYEQQ